MQNITLISNIDDLNRRAAALYAERVQNVDEDEREACAIECLEIVIAEAGLEEVARARTEFEGDQDTRIYADASGAWVNCWFTSPNPHFGQNDFDGVGFDDQVEWHAEREEVETY